MLHNSGTLTVSILVFEVLLIYRLSLERRPLDVSLTLNIDIGAEAGNHGLFSLDDSSLFDFSVRRLVNILGVLALHVGAGIDQDVDVPS